MIVVHYGIECKSVIYTHDQIDDELQKLLKPRKNLLSIAAEDGVQDVGHFSQDVDIIFILKHKQALKSTLHT